MNRFSKYFSIAVILLYFVVGIYFLVSPRVAYLKKEIRVIFAIFLFLYASYRLARVLTKKGPDGNA